MWTWLGVIAAGSILFTVSWLLPVVFRPHREEELLKTAVDRLKGRKHDGAADPGALSIAPADGYQYGDDHPWDGEKQVSLVDRLEQLLNPSLTQSNKAPSRLCGDGSGCHNGRMAVW